MKKIIISSLFFATLLLTLFSTKVCGQDIQAVQSRYKDLVVENSNADADIKVVGDFLNSLVSGDLEKAKSLLTENFKGYGPAPADSNTAEQTLSSWKENYISQSNRKVDFLPATFMVLSGNLKGEWVSVWGTYSFTQDGKNLSFPFQYTARVTGGKIDTDRVYYDRLYIFQTLGYKLTPPEKGIK
jgi:ketosteroid isomerase-like protein